MPESPRWLIFKGREADAVQVLGALSGTDEESDYVKEEFQAIKDTVLEASKGSFRDLFTMDENRHFHRVVLAYVNQMFQQISGINLIVSLYLHTAWLWVTSPSIIDRKVYGGPPGHTKLTMV